MHARVCMWPRVYWSSSIIRHSTEDIINPIQSARMRTINSFSFTYGTVEIRAKMPRGDWIWPGNFYFIYLDLYGPFNHGIQLFLCRVKSHVDDAHWQLFRSLAKIW